MAFQEIEVGDTIYEFPEEMSDSEILKILKPLFLDPNKLEKIDSDKGISRAIEENNRRVSPDQEQESGNIYKALNTAEMGSLKRQFIRTKVDGSGSSAYGPVQITGSLAKAVMKKDDFVANLTSQEIDYAERFVEQSRRFLRYGGGDWKKFPNGDKGLTQDQLKQKYEYGKSGDLTSDNDQKLYVRFASKLIDFLLKTEGKDNIDNFWRVWRFGSADKVSRDKRYSRRYSERLAELSISEAELDREERELSRFQEGTLQETPEEALVRQAAVRKRLGIEGRFVPEKAPEKVIEPEFDEDLFGGAKMEPGFFERGDGTFFEITTSGDKVEHGS